MDKNIPLSFVLCLIGGIIQVATLFVILVALVSEISVTPDAVIYLPIVWIFSIFFLLEGYRRLWL